MNQSNPESQWDATHQPENSLQSAQKAYGEISASTDQFALINALYLHQQASVASHRIGNLPLRFDYNRYQMQTFLRANSPRGDSVSYQAQNNFIDAPVNLQQTQNEANSHIQNYHAEIETPVETESTPVSNVLTQQIE